MVKALIFDFDGVIVLSERPRFEVIQQIALQNGIQLQDDLINKIIGKTTSTFLNEILSEKEKEHVVKILEGYEKEYKNNITSHIVPIESTMKFINSYNGSIPLALASMSSRKVIETLLDFLGIEDKFKAIATRDDVMFQKPNPEVYIKTAKELHVENFNECVVFEDSLVGTQAALHAGMSCYVILNGFNSKEHFEGMNISGFVEKSEDIYDIIHKTV